MAMKTKTTTNIEVLTRQGTELFHQGKLRQAVVIFEDAYRQATQLNDASCVCNSAFNLGAVYIANQEPDKGLELLSNAWETCGDLKDNSLHADLYYNYGLAYELQNKLKEAVNYLELALEEYQKLPDKTLTMADLTAKIAQIYTGLNNAPQAAKNHQVAAALYAQMMMFDKHMVQQCKEAAQLLQGGREERAKEAADSCMTGCQNMKDKDKLGHVYNELGLIYSQCNEFEKAATCFEMAHPLSQLTPGGSSMQAVILQNLGATYNTLRRYQQAIHFHEQAAAHHAAQGNRKSQGKCFLNLAYAYSQLGQHDEAGEFYLHALQAAKDTGSKHDQWQAMEGTGVVAFHENRLERAEKYFMMALDTLKAAPETTSVAGDRIAGKLRDVREYLMMQETISGGNSPKGEIPTEILVIDPQRPPTREEQRQIVEQREWRRVGKIERQFDVVARGIGEYVSDSDCSFRRHRRNKRSHRREQKEDGGSYDEVDYRPVSRWSNRTRPQTFRENDTTRKHHRSDTAVSYHQHKYVATSGRTESERKHVHSRNTYQRSFSEERRVHYHHPQSTDDDSYVRRRGNHHSERDRQHRKEVTSSDDHTDPRRSGVKKRSHRMQNSDSSDSRSSVSSDEDLARYAERLGMADEEEEVTDSRDEEEDSEGKNSDSREESTDQPGPLEDSSRYLPSPPPVPRQLPPSSRNQLMSTYEKPVSVDQLADGKMAGNYFRAHSADSRPEATGHITPSSKETIPDDKDPTYVTIHSMNRTRTSFRDDGDVMPSTSYEMAPPVPQRNSGPSSPNKSTGLPYDPNDPEIRELHLDSQLGQEWEDDVDPLPSRKKSKKKKTTSSMCIVM